MNTETQINIIVGVMVLILVILITIILSERTYAPYRFCENKTDNTLVDLSNTPYKSELFPNTMTCGQLKSVNETI